MKRCIAFLIIISLLFNAIGFYLIYKGMLRLHKKEMKALLKKKINHEFIELIKIPAGGEASAGLVFIEPHEFTYQDKMFDIVKKEIINDTTYYYCINDIKEQYLKKQIKQEHSKRSSSPSSYFVNLLHLLFNQAIHGQYLKFFYDGCTVKLLHEMQNKLLIRFLKPLIPPPKAFHS